MINDIRHITRLISLVSQPLKAVIVVVFFVVCVLVFAVVVVLGHRILTSKYKEKKNVGFHKTRQWGKLIQLSLFGSFSSKK